MNAVIPYYNLNPKQKKIIISANQKLYKKASKKEKTLILNDLQIITGYSRKYIIYLLNTHNKTITRKGNVILKADITKTSTSKRAAVKKSVSLIITEPLLKKHVEEMFDLGNYRNFSSPPTTVKLLYHKNKPDFKIP